MADQAPKTLKKYRVTVMEQCNYSIDVEAESEEQAEENAIDVMVNTETRDKYFQDCQERDATSVIENPPDWEESI
jgi:hypothetical protein